MSEAVGQRVGAAVGDWFLPSGLQDPAEIRRTRAAILGAGLGFFCASSTSAIYGYFGSPWSSAAIALIAVGLLFSPFAIRHGVSPEVVGNSMLGVTYVATWVTASRSGGFASPSLAWAFVFPAMAYVACTWRSVVAWVGLSMAMVAAFFVMDKAGVQFAQDFSAGSISVLRASGHVLVILSTAMALGIAESVRQAAQRALDVARQSVERERILSDMHDGLGSQLLGLIHQARTHEADAKRWAPALESCFDDLRIIVDSLDPIERPLATALGELRSRFQPRFATAGVELVWRCEVDGLTDWSTGDTVQVLRTLQELLTNALRHAQANRVEVSALFHAEAPARLELSVSDNGVGFDSAHPPRVGRGLKSLASRAKKLGGQLVVSGAEPGTRATLSCPTGPERTIRSLPNLKR